RDWGVGIPPENQADLFVPFYRGSNVTRTAGSGLGLAVVKTCVDRQGGEVTITSGAGRGTTVTVRFFQPLSENS
ncbi:sensor histidine kinase, partial [Haemophilus parainfluenzae]|uniref:sensor histidine kinase n=1 Tax=Haemophilus parainfluenzae TaxID=729 RepID=UPI00124B8C6F